MTVDVATPTARYTIAGIGPYALAWPYFAASVFVSAESAGTRVALVDTDFTTDPLSSTTAGNLYLTPAAAATHAGKTLVIERDTPEQQGWAGQLGEREKGMEVQLDRQTMSAQEHAARLDGTLRVAGLSVPPLVPVQNSAVLWKDGAFVSGPTANEVGDAQGFAAISTEKAGIATDAAADAQASANAAALYDGPRFGTIALMQAGTGFADGKFVRVDKAFNAQIEGFVYDAASTMTADGALIVDATGMGVGRLISTRTSYATLAEALADGRTLPLGTSLSVTGIPNGYKVVSSGEDMVLAGGAKIKVNALWVGASDGVYHAAAFGVVADDNTDQILKVQLAINKMGTRGTLLFPSGTINVSSAVDFRNKDRMLFSSDGGLTTLRQISLNTPVCLYGASTGTLPQRGGLRGFMLLHSSMADISHTESFGIKFWSTSDADFDIKCQNNHTPIGQASTVNAAGLNVVFENRFHSVFIYGFVGTGIQLNPIGTAATPNAWTKIYINGGGETVVAGIDIRGSADTFSGLNIENMKASLGLFYSSGSGSAVTVETLYIEKAVITAAARGMIYNGVNTLRISHLVINSTDFDVADVATVKILTAYDGVIDIGSLTVKGITFTGAASLKLLHAFNGATNPAKHIKIGTISDIGGVITDFGDTRDTLCRKFGYQFAPEQALAFSSFFNPDFRKGEMVKMTLAGNTTCDSPLAGSRIMGRTFTLRFAQDGTGGRTVSWGADYVIKTPVDVTANAVTIWRLIWDGSKWREV